MELQHEFIEYKYEKLPVNWIYHDGSHAGTAILPHWHASIEISYTVRESIDNFTIGTQEYKTKEKDVLIINATEVHSVITNHYSIDAKALTIQLSYDFLKDLIPGFEFMRFVTHPTGNIGKMVEIKSLQSCLETFYTVAQDTVTAQNKVKLLSIIYELVHLLMKDWMYRVEQSTYTRANSKSLGKIEEMVAFLNLQYANTYSLQEIAAYFHISPQYLSKLFKEQLNMGVMTYLQLVRMRNGQQLLLTTDKPIHVISDLVGFPNEKSFRTAFVRVFGKTPKQYQKEMRKTID